MNLDYEHYQNRKVSKTQIDRNLKYKNVIVMSHTDGHTPNAITHNGTFHADEVMSTAILSHICATGMVSVLRTQKVDDTLKTPMTIVYDIDGGAYDHHQPGGNGARPNGVPYSSCGLLWRDYGMNVCKSVTGTDVGAEMVWSYVDENLIQGIDAEDNGTFPKPDYPCTSMTVSDIISMYNPAHVELTTPTDDGAAFSNYLESIQFIKAVKFADKMLKLTIDIGLRAASCVDELFRILDATSRMEGLDKHILLLHRRIPWEDVLFGNLPDWAKDAANQLLYVVYPAKRGGWQWRAIPTSKGSYEQRNVSPAAWWGTQDESAATATGVPEATFVHKNGFIGGATTKEACVQLAKKAIKEGTGHWDPVFGGPII